MLSSQRSVAVSSSTSKIFAATSWKEFWLWDAPLKLRSTESWHKGLSREFISGGRRGINNLLNHEVLQCTIYEYITKLQTDTNMASFNPTQIFEDGTTEEKGENARLSAFVGAIAVGDLGVYIPFFLCYVKLILSSQKHTWSKGWNYCVLKQGSATNLSRAWTRSYKAQALERLWSPTMEQLFLSR